ncbi:hypothetical protein GOP47_0018742 [Adiantum capillus-veneris]|uniref:Neprosin PEP catalytic domain-containing protein n=1 Tax=Adiantum capillus-veneris TaxID=13818 RepID=A0A9D4UDS0_ADICA|nr:hypothetical protein GOP47_0018742 [Adiantum capillus-veneris]
MERSLHARMMCSILVMLMTRIEAARGDGVNFPFANLTGVKRPAQLAHHEQPASAFSVVTLASHELSSGKVIDCAASQFPKAGSGWRKPSRAARALFEPEVADGCSAHVGSMAAQLGDIFEDVVHIHTPSDLKHSYAIYSAISEGDLFTGSTAALTINKPYVQDGEVSIGQIWVIANREDKDNYSTLEVHPVAFEDDDPRLFIYWTNDNYGETGCFNRFCSGFVQTDFSWTLGEKFPSGTSILGDSNGQKYVLFAIFKEPRSGRWFLQLDANVIGYWA